MRHPSFSGNPLTDLILLGFVLGLLFGIGLGSRPYSAPSESRYIEIGREMAQSGDFVTPRLNYVKYFEKPPLFYWIQAESTRLFGFDPLSARLPTAGFAVLLGLLTYGLGRMLYGRLAGILSALLFGTTLYLFALSRIVLLDVPESFFMAATLTGFLYAAYAPPGAKRTLMVYAMYVAAAGAVLTKGLIGVVLPGAVAVLWLLFTRNWRLLRDLRIASGTLLFLALSVPWHVLVAGRNPEWAWFYFVHEHWLRFFTKEAGRYQPFWFFAVVLVAGLFPWITFFWQATADALRGFWAKRHEDGRPLFLVLWIAFIFVFFSISGSKLIPYILPVFPPLMVLLGRYFANAWEEKTAPYFTTGLWAFILLLVAMAVVPSLLLDVLGRDSKVTLALVQGGDELKTLSIASMIAAGLLLVIFIQGRRRHVIMALLLVAAVILQLGDGVGAHYNKDSMKNFADTIRAARKPGDEVAMVQIYYQDMPLYVQDRITIAGWKGELEFGAEHEDASAWMMDDAAFWKRWLANDHRMFAVMREETFQRLTKDKTAESLHLYPLNQEGRNMLFLNRPPFEPQPDKDKRKP
jgi:TM2 domain-containing membrane protein YozV